MLARDMGRVWDAYQDSRYGYVTNWLPSLLAQAQSAGRAYTGEGRERAKGLLALTHQAAAMILTKLGETPTSPGLRLIVAWLRRKTRVTRL